jgi:PAS domain S-box-containing protein
MTTDGTNTRNSVTGEAVALVRESDPHAENEIFRRLVEGVREYAIFFLDPKGIVTTWNQGAQAIKGYTREEVVGQHFSKFYLPEAVESGWPMRELELAAKEGRFADEGWRVKKDGSSFWASVTITAVRDENGELMGFSKVTRDLTDRKLNEERIQDLNQELRMRVNQLAESQRVVELRTLELQRLSSQLLRVQDSERQRLARELHDELGQQLSGLGMVLGMVENAGNNPKISQAAELADTALKTVRNLSYLLHPPLLDEVGLTAALDWYVRGLAKRNSLEVSLSLKPTSFPRLHKDIEITIFRIVQESLTNAYRHAETKSARVDIEKQADTVMVIVRDYGKGLPPEMFEGGRMTPRMFGVGLSGMRERVRQFGGELSVSREEPGTKVEAKILLFGHPVT